MKTTIFSLLLLSLTVIVCGSRKTDSDHGDRKIVDLMITGKNPNYDKELAAQFRADEYGMSNYVLAFLKAGPIQDQDSSTAVKLQQAHLKNINRMAEEGKLVVAGPFLDEGEIRGIYIFDVASIEEARRLTETDPAIRAGRLTMELHPWYGSAALKKVNPIHRALAKKTF